MYIIIFRDGIAHKLLKPWAYAPLVTGTTFALLEINARFLKPARIRNTIYGVRNLDKKPSEMYNSDTITFRHKVKNQGRDSRSNRHGATPGKGMATKKQQ